jgi:hypothetical protein
MNWTIRWRFVAREILMMFLPRLFGTKTKTYLRFHSGRFYEIGQAGQGQASSHRREPIHGGYLRLSLPQSCFETCPWPA